MRTKTWNVGNDERQPREDGMARLIIQRPTPNVVTVSTPRVGAALSILFQVGFLAL